MFISKSLLKHGMGMESRMGLHLIEQGKCQVFGSAAISFAIDGLRSMEWAAPQSI